ncbi:MAG: hypothetical protein ACE37F_26875 [Nannocystaceae bacterium]|nr:hypothetical protein [bacterium]
MDRVPSLTPRQQRLLYAVCRDYVLTGEPASSGRLVKMHGLPWSSATVRQEFAVLERDGFLVRSHHSSGRLPTRAGLERYVASLAGATALPPHLATIVDRGLAAAGHSVNDEVRAASAVLSEVAGCVAVSFVGAARGGRIDTVDVAPLVLPRALVVLGFGDGSTAMRTVSIEALADEPDAADRQVRALQAHLRELCTGRSLDEALARLRGLQQAQQARIDRALAEALRVGLIVCAGASLDPLWLQVAGQRTLAGGDGVRTEALGEVLGLLEDYERLAEVLCQLVPHAEAANHRARARAHVRFGVPMSRAEQPVRLTVVGCRLPVASVEVDAGARSTGMVALLGSDRMDYARAIPLVEYAARSLAAHGETTGESGSDPTP